MKLRKCLAGFGPLCGAYILFAGTISGSEALAAIPAVICATIFFILQGYFVRRPLVLRAPWGKIAKIILMMLARDTIMVSGALLRSMLKPSGGAIVTQPFEPGGRTAVSAGRRAAVILVASFAPNGYVVGVTRNTLLLHQLVCESEKPDRKWPL